MNSALQIVRSSLPDIALFQELDASLISSLEPGFESSLKRGSVRLNESLPSKDGVGVFYNPKRFEMEEEQSVRFSNVLDKHLPSLGEASRSETSSISLTRALYRETREKLNQVVMVRLKDIESEKRILACSTHLYWDPAYPDIKLLQSYLLAKEIEEFSQGCSGVVVGADLNSVPDASAVYELLMGSGAVETSHGQHPVSLRSNKLNKRLKGVDSVSVPALVIGKPYRSAFREINGSEPRYTNYTSSFKGCLDYVMLDGSLKVHSVEPILSDEELCSETALPNSMMPSDHLPLIVDLEYS
jgi:mRNA deadenylase 3'-5' endonuclease subunit Ccr4